mmetsp:Transcript_41503/g.100798  ORF Transcript_41503/g.100798 Transcript_41503/m.100798 type:complete len:171 (-) Transcript_41503:420-932(-)
MAVWGGYVLHAHVMQPRQHQVTAGDKFACMNADDLFLLDLNTYKWSSPVVNGTPPSPRGGHSMVLVHNKLVIYGGGDLTYTYGMEQWHERDVGTVHWLDTTTWTYGAPSIPNDEVPEVRGGHTSHLISHEGKLCLLVLGGRRYLPPSPEDGNAGGEHFGRVDAHLLQLSK